jgi:hypothetical protein
VDDRSPTIPASRGAVKGYLNDGDIGSEGLQRPLGPPNWIDSPNQPFGLLLAWETIRAI